jgi:hypothetical protein
VTLGWRGGEAEDALQVDVYLESLLASHDRRPQLAFELAPGDALDASERTTARFLADHLVRFHPSFRFEEALAGRLRTVAGGSPAGVGATDAGPTLLAFPGTAAVPTDAAVVATADVDDRGDTATALEGGARGRFPSQEQRRVLIGGAIASGVSLAGAAIVAWRATSPPRTAFGRATRAAHRGRPSQRGRA